ncbi:ribonuclease-like 3 [Chanodichthys erythropterus]|uniref:ribonuclease-like 3 n=1 Tax=Chanodichthys erythropterus TaxID=933992 RepID=UPI00351DC636
MEIHQSAVILLLILSVSSFTHGQPADIRQRYEKFRNQHVDPYMTEDMCTRVIKSRRINVNGRQCKPVNSFIAANEHQINEVCGRGGTPQGGDLFESNQPFFVVKCTSSGGTYYPNCQYSGRSYTRKIVLLCDRGWPVHYEP